MDACEPYSFNAVLGTGACTRNVGVRAWHFTPSRTHLAVGDVLQAINRGGETHTLTEVPH